MLRRILLTNLFAIGLLVSMAQSARAQAERTFAVVPQHGAASLAEQWQPLLEELSQQTGVKFRFITAPSVTEFERRLLKGKYDYAYMNSALYLEANKQRGYRGLAQKQKPLKGILVVREDGPKTIYALSGKTIAFPAPRAFGATLLTRADLQRSGINYTVAYLGTHESAYRAVARGQFVAAGGVKRSFDTLPESVKEKLRILHTTASAPPHVIAANKSVPSAEALRVGKALRTLKQHRRGKEALDRLHFQNLVAVNTQSLRELSKLEFPARRDTRAIAFHVIPRLDERNTREQMQPLAAYLQRRLEVQVTVETHSTMGAFEKTIYAEKRPAMINANPVQAIRLAKKGYVIVAQQLPVNSPEGMRGLVLVREDSPIKSIADLENKRIAFGGNKNAFFATIVPKALLHRGGLKGKYIDESKPGPVSDVIKRIRNGDIDAGGAGTMAINSKVLQSKFGVHKMRVVARSKPMPGLAWLLSGSIEPALREEIKGLLLHYSAAAPGHAALRAGGVSGMRPAKLQDYGVVNEYLNGLP